jgi:hypothetical protein
MAAPARAAKISWRVCYKRLNGRVSRWTDLQTFNAAPLDVPSWRTPPITDRCESLHRGRSRLCFKRPLARPTQPLLPEPACRADGEGVEKWDALCTSVTPLTSPGKECEGGVMTFKAQW